MSESAYGYLEPALNEITKANLIKYIEDCEIGVFEIKEDELYNYPTNMLPKDKNVFMFSIGDTPYTDNPRYLLDYGEYDPRIDIGFPHDGKKRLNILLNVLKDMVAITHATKLYIALTTSEDIIEIKKINQIDMCEIIHADFQSDGVPPNTLYEITV